MVVEHFLLIFKVHVDVIRIGWCNSMDDLSLKQTSLFSCEISLVAV